MMEGVSRYGPAPAYNFQIAYLASVPADRLGGS